MFHARNRLYHRVRTCKTHSRCKTKEKKTSKQYRGNAITYNPVRFIHFLFLQSDENIKITARNFRYFRAIWLMTNFREYENLHPVHSRRLSNMNNVYLHFLAQNSPIIYPLQLNGEPVSRSLHDKIRFRKTKPKINQNKSRRESKTLFHRRHQVIFKLYPNVRFLTQESSTVMYFGCHGNKKSWQCPAVTCLTFGVQKLYWGDVTDFDQGFFLPSAKESEKDLGWHAFSSQNWRKIWCTH